MVRNYRLVLAALLFTPLLLRAQDEGPLISLVVNGVTHTNAPLPSGVMIEVHGQGWGTSTTEELQLEGDGRLKTELLGVQVLFDGNPAPLLSVSPAVIQAIVPSAINGPSKVRVQFRGVQSKPFEVSIVPFAPAILTADSSGRGPGHIRNLDGSRNSSSNPAVRGSFVTVQMVGYGPTDPPAADGEIALTAASATAPLEAWIGGKSARVLYAGSSIGSLSGSGQATIQIPPDLPYGGELPIRIQVGDMPSQDGVSVAVAGLAPPIIAAPTALTVTPTDNGAIGLGWTAADQLAMRFHIERRVYPLEVFVTVASVPSTTLAFTDSNITKGTVYSYRVRAEGEYAFSPYSEVSDGMVPSVELVPPSSLRAAAIGTTQVQLSWSSPGNASATLEVERRAGGGSFSLLASVSGNTTTYEDRAVTAGTSYTYRIRSKLGEGVSPYSSEVSVTMPALPPPAPSLSASATSAGQIRLSWVSGAPNVLRFRLERRTGSGTFVETSQPGPLASTFEDNGLSPLTVYSYRLRVETVTGMSGYSNEVTATTGQAPPAAPAGLRGVATSTTQISLTWSAVASANAVRVELRSPNGSFSDIGPAAGLSSTAVTNLKPGTSYVFRVRAQNSAGYSPYSNEANVTTQAVPTTVFLIHGLGQGRFDMQGLAGSLTGTSGIDMTRFRVDAGFDFSECADAIFCPSNCNIATGAQRLAQYIVNANPPGDIVLVGFSMGGLIARDLLANGRVNLNGRKVAALITLGTPNLGYPYTFIDTVASCTALVQQMDGNWRSQQASNTVVLSQYLLSLSNQWPSKSYPGNAGVWLAASGRSCSNPQRTINATTGCRDRNPSSDGVVCDDSATYSISTAAGTSPNRYWQDPGQIYVHSNHGFGSSFILCGNGGQNPTLSNPPSFGPLFTTIKGLINGL